MSTNGATGDGGGDGGYGKTLRVTGSYEQWTFGAGAAYAALAAPLSAARYVPGVVELPPGVPLNALAANDGEDAQARVLFPLLWRGFTAPVARTSWLPVLIDFGDPKARSPLTLQSIDATLGALAAQAVTGEGATKPIFKLNAPLPAATLSPRGARRMASPDAAVKVRLTSPGETRQLVVMAVIDDGIPFAHRNLMNAAGNSTRVEYCGLQSQDGNGNILLDADFTRDDIDALRAVHGPDEDAIYGQAGALENGADYSATLGHFASHGAHVLDAAAGRRNDDADLDLLRVIAVQLPAPVTIDTAGYRKDGAVLAALHYIFTRADDIAQAYLGDAHAPVPLVINFSYGFTGGPHDGSDPLELAMAQLVAARIAQNKPTELVMPAGNSFADAMLGQITPGALGVGQAFDIPWRLQPNDATPSYLEIWLPMSGAAATYSLAVADPRGRSVAAGASLGFTVGAGGSAISANLSLDGSVTGHVDIAPFNSAWTLARVVLAPTEPHDQTLPAAPAGRWTVSLARTGGAAPVKPVSCRIHRDSDPFGYTRGGKQSYFDDPLDERYTLDGAPTRIENPANAFVRRFGTVSGLATHDQVTVVSSYYADTGRATEHASAGPLTNGPNVPGAVRFSMPADTSTALRGALASGTRSGSAMRLSGTSMAAPLYARMAALRHMNGVVTPPATQPLTVPTSAAEAAERPIRLGHALAG